jgi:6-phosphogluconolactonase (cycloisomerase 2 family)
MKAYKSFAFSWAKRLMLGALGLVLALLIYGLLQLIEPVEVAPIAQSSAQSLQFAGRALLVASDADMVATAYADAKLDRVPGIEDTLTVVGLPLNPEKPAISMTQVSNSVMSWPQIIAVSPNGQRVYVAEVRSRPADGIQEFETIDQMPAGKQITVVDIANPGQPKVMESVNVGRNPEHLSISPDGKFLAVNLDDPGRELLLVQLQADGRLGNRFYFPMPTDGTRQDNYAAIWHPSGQFLAMTQNRNRQVGFYKVRMGETDQVSITPYSAPLTVGNHLSNARFTSDGRFLLVPDLKWSTRGNRILNALMNPKGEIIAIRFEPELGKAPEIVSRAEVGLSPEGFAVNPEQSLIATVNMRRTYLPPFPPVWRGKPYSSLSLVKFDRTSGLLTAVGEYGFEGLLPEQAAFDATGKSLAVVIYNYREPSPRTGAIEFWNVSSGNDLKLERTGYTIDVVRGAHDVVLVP